MNARRLRKILVTALATSAAACGGGTTDDFSSSGSSSGGSSSGGSSSGVVPPAPLTRPYDCSSAQQTYEAIRASTSSDYVEIRNTQTGTSPPGYRVDASAGEKCKTATDKPACEQALAALSSTTFMTRPCGGCAPGGSYLAHTKGDAVGKVTSIAELRTWLGSVNHAAEAWILAWTGGYSIDCSKEWIVERDDGWLVTADVTLSDCPVTTQRVLVLVRRDGSVEVVQRGDKKESNACAGRRPEGLVAARRRAGDRKSPLGRHFADVARLEAASVEAFRILRRELAAHGAPKSLLRAAERAMADEVRHAREMAKLARRFGAKVERPRVEKRPVRDLFAIAAENAVEGCVNETYGAMEAMFQARTAADPEVRAAMETIARDETRHAALSWRVATWIERRLSPAERTRLRALRDEAVGTLARRNAAARDRSLVGVAGIPDAAAASALTASLRTSLWS